MSYKAQNNKREAEGKNIRMNSNNNQRGSGTLEFENSL
jgi:hypothetical protein